MAVYKCGGTCKYDGDGQPLCDYEAPKTWRGRCPKCSMLWTPVKVGAERADKSHGTLSELLVNTKETQYIPTSVDGFDRVIGGGLVAGSSILFGGSRGAGKSSLMMAVCQGIASGGKRVLYASGEESTEDVVKIARRLGVTSDRIEIMGNALDIDEIMQRVEDLDPFLIILDSLQVVTCDDSKGAEGSVAQGEAVANILTGHCKRKKKCSIIINHMTKLGEFKGSTEVEHLVDTIAMLDRYFDYDDEGEPRKGTENLRLLVGDKNRNGREGEKAFFEMTDEGLKSAKKSKVLHLV